MVLREVLHPPWLLAHFKIFVCKTHANESLAPSIQHGDLIIVHSLLPRHWPVPLYCSHIIVVCALSCVADSQLVLFHLCNKAPLVFSNLLHEVKEGVTGNQRMLAALSCAMAVDP